MWSFGAHIGAVKAVAVDEAGEILATGGEDEYIKLFNLKTRTERGELFQHKGSITALAFYKSSHLLSASVDGTVCIWRTHDWLCLHVLGGHKDAVTCLALHPSGRMALSGSKDRTLRLWNLVEGRCAYITKPTFPKVAVIDRIEWSPSGSFYAMVAAGTLHLFDATQAGKPTPISTHVQPKRINGGKFLSDSEFVFGGDDMQLQVLSVSTGAVLRRVQADDAKARIKDISVVFRNATEQTNPLVVSVSSSGSVNLWDLTKEDGDKDGSSSCLLATAAVPGSASRLTCMAVSTMTRVLDNDDVAAPKQAPRTAEAPADSAPVEEEGKQEKEAKAKKPAKSIKASRKPEPEAVVPSPKAKAKKQKRKP
jgi:protein MAK11